jgi:hypothetical protein
MSNTLGRPFPCGEAAALAGCGSSGSAIAVDSRAIESKSPRATVPARPRVVIAA